MSMAIDRPLILRASAIPYRLPLGSVWRSRIETLDERRGFLVELETGEGSRGYGDCAPLPFIGTETLPQAEARLQELLHNLMRLSPAEALTQLPSDPKHPAARCGVETALLDLLARREGKPLHRWLNPQSNPEILVNASLGGLDEKTAIRARTALQDGFRVLKLKVGISDLASELQLLERLSGELPADTQLRLDANRAWEPEEARRFLRGIEGLPVESLEEPLRQSRLEELAELQTECGCALALDESLAELDIEQLLQQPPVRRLILKPTARGGLLPAMELAKRAAAAGIEGVVTTSLDSAAGVWAAAQLAAACANPLAHGLATAEWLAQDVGRPPHVENGVIRLPAIPGSGFIPHEYLLATNYQVS